MDLEKKKETFNKRDVVDKGGKYGIGKINAGI